MQITQPPVTIIGCKFLTYSLLSGGKTGIITYIIRLYHKFYKMRCYIDLYKICVK